MAAVAPAGMRQADLAAALRERAALLSAGGGAWQHEDDAWDIDESADSNEDEDAEDAGEGRGGVMRPDASIAPGNGLVDRSSLSFRDGQAAFAGSPRALARHKASLDDAGSDVSKVEEEIDGETMNERLRESVHRLRRIQGQVEMLEEWTGARRAAHIEPGFLVASQESAQVSRQASELLGLVQQAVTRAGERSGGGPEAYRAALPPQRVWLPAPEVVDGQIVRQLAATQRAMALGSAPGYAAANVVQEEGELKTPEPGAGASKSSTYHRHTHLVCPHGDGSAFYEFEGVMGGHGGWMTSGDETRDLEARVARLKGILGAASANGVPLLGAAASLQRRLEVLQRALDDGARVRLSSSVRVLAREIDVAVEEGRRFEALDDAERAQRQMEEAEQTLGEQALDEEPPADRVAALHARTNGLGALVARVGDVELRLAEQEDDFQALTSFARDLAGAEARMARTKAVLTQTLGAAEAMKASVKSSGVRIRENVAALEAKIESRLKSRETLSS